MRAKKQCGYAPNEQNHLQYRKITIIVNSGYENFNQWKKETLRNCGYEEIEMTFGLKVKQ